MKIFLGVCIVALGFARVAVSQVLATGDIAIIGANAVNSDEFAFVALVDIPQGTVIGFVDHGWLESGAYRTNEDELFYTAPSTITKGTTIIIDTVAGAPRFSESGDQLIAFQGSIASPTFVYALNFEGDGVWQTDATNSNTSALPTGLVNGSTAVAVAECTGNNHVYTGSTTGTKSELLALIGNKSNWNCSASRQTFGGSFIVTDGGSNSFPEFQSPTETGSAVASSQIQIQYTAIDSDSNILTFGGIGLPTGSNIDSNTGVFTWTPLESQVGSNTFTITVTDGIDTASISVTITVSSVIQSRTPTFTVTPPDTLVAGGVAISLPFTVSDPEGLSIASYTIEPASIGSSISNSAFTWTTNSTPDIYKFTITATDAEGLSVSHDLYVGVSGVLFEGERETALMASLQGAYTPSQTLGYDVARDTMYAKVDLDRDGFVRGIYTGFAVEYTGGDPSTQMFNGGINAEHSWPQSMGAGNEPQRSDMHFLFPAKDNVNSTRSNHPYADIPDNETQTWFAGSTSQSSVPTVDIDSYSEYASGRFEPREAVKGDIARAMLYFNTVYNAEADNAFFRLQAGNFIEWNSSDPVSGKEIRRSGIIRHYQGNINPFLLDWTLDDRLYVLLTNTVDDEIPIAFGIESVFPNPSSGRVTIQLSGDGISNSTIYVVNTLGQRVANLFTGVIPYGISQILLDSKLPSGLYQVVMQTDTSRSSWSIVLMN